MEPAIIAIAALIVVTIIFSAILARIAAKAETRLLLMRHGYSKTEANDLIKASLKHSRTYSHRRASRRLRNLR